MLVVMQSHATEEQVRAVCDRIESLGLKAHPIPGSNRTAIGITGNNGAIDLGSLEAMSGVIECIPVTKPYKLVSRDVKEETTIVRIPTPSGDVWSAARRWPSSPARARSKTRAGLAVRSASRRRARTFFAEARTSRALLRTVFRAWAAGAEDSCESPRTMDLASSRKRLTTNRSTSWKSGQTSSKSARATCRIFRS